MGEPMLVLSPVPKKVRPLRSRDGNRPQRHLRPRRRKPSGLCLMHQIL
nr:MAG TPA: hypothetical protein [Caudoviricetes sp.]